MGMEENIVQDSIETRIRTKCINDSCHMIDIFLCKKYLIPLPILIYIMLSFKFLIILTTFKYLQIFVHIH